jgi:hypothetical protein
MRTSAVRAAVIGVVLVMSATGAQAFSIVPGETNADGSAKFTDPDQLRHRFSDQSQSGSNTSGLRIGNTTLQFSSPSNSQSGPSPFIRDQFLDNPAARTVPSQSR